MNVNNGSVKEKKMENYLFHALLVESKTSTTIFVIPQEIIMTPNKKRTFF